jgi:hypothetical protein
MEQSRRCALVLTAALLVAATACSSSAKPAAAPAPTSATTTTRPAAVAVLGPLHKASEQAISAVYAQGVAHTPNGWIFSGTNSLWRTDNALKEVVSANPALPAAWSTRGFNHIGDIDVIGKYIYAPLEQPDYTKGRQATARFDRDTLRFVDAVTLPQHENSFVTIDPETMTAYSMDHFDGNTLLRYDVAHSWKRLPVLRLSTTLHHTQGADILNGVIWISTSDTRNDLYGVDLRTGKVRSNGSMGHTGGQGEGEGLDATALASGFVHTLCIDPKINPVWLEHFALA